jgi:exodeoxyribonuclease III
MKIVTWNVNGFRAVQAKGKFAHILELNADVICLQEIKVQPEQLSEETREIPGYTAYWNSGTRAGYSGVATFSRVLPLTVENGLRVEKFDVEGRVIRSDFKEFVLFNIYFPNGQRGLDRLDYKLEFYAKLLEICDDLHSSGKGIIITGDFNTAHNNIDLKNPKENSKTSGFLPEERVWIDRYLSHGFVDVFRSLYPEKVQYTWWTYRMQARKRGIGWRLDYYLVSESLMPLIKDTTIYDKIEGSDHCPVMLEIGI